MPPTLAQLEHRAARALLNRLIELGASRALIGADLSAAASAYMTLVAAAEQRTEIADDEPEDDK